MIFTLIFVPGGGAGTFTPLNLGLLSPGSDGFGSGMGLIFVASSSIGLSSYRPPDLQKLVPMPLHDIRVKQYLVVSHPKFMKNVIYDP